MNVHLGHLQSEIFRHEKNSCYCYRNSNGWCSQFLQLFVWFVSKVFECFFRRFVACILSLSLTMTTNFWISDYDLWACITLIYTESNRIWWIPILSPTDWYCKKKFIFRKVDSLSTIVFNKSLYQINFLDSNDQISLVFKPWWSQQWSGGNNPMKLIN